MNTPRAAALAGWGLTWVVVLGCERQLPLDADAATPACVVQYTSRGCGAEARPICARPYMDACLAIIHYCGCDGRTTVEGGCGFSEQPYLYMGDCRVPDGGVLEPCRRELSKYICPSANECSSCPPRFDGTGATAPACAPGYGGEVQLAGTCEGRRVLRRAWTGNLSIMCFYAPDSGALVSARQFTYRGDSCTGGNIGVADDPPAEAACPPESLSPLPACTPAPRTTITLRAGKLR